MYTCIYTYIHIYIYIYKHIYIYIHVYIQLQMVSLLCMPREQVQGRLHNIVSGIATISGLIFAGVAGSALNPLNVKDFDSDDTKRNLANFYNLAASFQFIIALSGTLFTTYVILEINFEPDATIFRCVASMDFFIVYVMLIFWSTFLLIAQLCSIIYIRSDVVWAWTTISGVLLIYYLLMLHWAIGMKAAFPNAFLHYFPILASLGVAPHWLFGSAWTKQVELARHTANMKLQGAEANFGTAVVSAVRSDVAREDFRAHVPIQPQQVAAAQVHTSNDFDASGDKAKALEDMLVCLYVDVCVAVSG